MGQPSRMRAPWRAGDGAAGGCRGALELTGVQRVAPWLQWSWLGSGLLPQARGKLGAVMEPVLLRCCGQWGAESPSLPGDKHCACLQLWTCSVDPGFGCRRQSPAWGIGGNPFQWDKGHRCTAPACRAMVLLPSGTELPHTAMGPRVRAGRACPAPGLAVPVVKGCGASVQCF